MMNHFYISDHGSVLYLCERDMDDWFFGYVVRVLEVRP